ncbi:hypothetical protein HN588_16260, partial [Candidatus Bathyarchaeota archaeon]|nr:hypothetical protein [Candidatus Bathyarchaeota archaeon]
MCLRSLRSLATGGGQDGGDIGGEFGGKGEFGVGAGVAEAEMAGVQGLSGDQV